MNEVERDQSGGGVVKAGRIRYMGQEQAESENSPAYGLWGGGRRGKCFEDNKGCGENILRKLTQ